MESDSAKKTRTYSRYTRDAAVLLGRCIRLERISRRMTERELAERIGISRTTLRKVERGELTCELGLVFEAAALVGVQLFDVLAPDSLRAKTESVAGKLVLLPRSVRNVKREVDDDF